MATQKSWLEELQAQLKDVRVSEEPDEEVQEGETVKGVLPPEDRTLWALREQLAHKTNAISKTRHSRTGAGCPECAEMAQGLVLCNVLDEMFWVACKTRFKIWDKGVGIRKGWRVVELKEDARQPSIISILTGLR